MERRKSGVKDQERGFSLSMIIISAMTRDHAIGSSNGLPWHVPEEYQHYLSLIKDQTVIMGSTSYKIFGADLTSAHNIIISRSVSKVPSTIVCSSIEEALEKANSFGKTVFSAGGSSIYHQTIPLADKMYLSFIKGDYQGDVFFS